MKKGAILSILLLVFFVTGCNKKNDVIVNSVVQNDSLKKEVSLATTTFPIESSELLNLFQGYSFYDTLQIVVINKIDELENIETKDKTQTLYLLAKDADGESIEEKEKQTMFIAQYGNYNVIYQGDNAEIQKALLEKLVQLKRNGLD